MTENRNRVPELAGLGTYAEAARVGYAVEDNVARLLRYQWVSRRIMANLVAHLPSTPTWEVKCGMALHQWQLAEHVEAMRQRVGEMRHPVPALDTAPHEPLDRWLEELVRSRDELELVAGVYGVALPALAAAYRDHLRASNLLVDHPSRRILRFALLELDEAVEWGARALGALLEGRASARDAADAWVAHLAAYLAAAGGIAGEGPTSEPPAAPRATSSFVPDLEPRRDDRFQGRYNFVFPPHEVYNHPDVPADERNLALLCKRTLEMDVPELMASIMVERPDLPWAFHREYARQLWDEARHAMMGTVALTARGVDWTRLLPLNVGFSLRLNLHATPLERQTILFGIEQSLMPSDTGKRFELETARAAGDPLSAHFHDYDWADEVLHAQIGRRWLKREGITPDEALRRAGEIHERTWAELDRYRDRDPQVDWWDAFVRRVLGRPAAVRRPVEGAPRILAE